MKTPQQFKDEMESILKNYQHDPEACHGEMEWILTDLGYGEGIKIFQSAPKWYA